jgi:hypothetical protein
MAKTQKQEMSKKKQLRKEIKATLETALVQLKEAVGEKKFERHVKKASKILSAGAAKSIGKITKSKTAA